MAQSSELIGPKTNNLTMMVDFLRFFKSLYRSPNHFDAIYLSYPTVYFNVKLLNLRRARESGNQIVMTVEKLAAETPLSVMKSVAL